MAFRATNIIPSKAYDQAKGIARNVKLQCLSYVTQLAANGATYQMLKDIYLFLKQADEQFGVLAAVPGLAAYAQVQENIPGYDVAAEFVAMRGAVQAVLSWMDTNVPTSVTAVAPAAWTPNGPMIATSFTPAQTLGLRTVLQAAADSVF